MQKIENLKEYLSKIQDGNKVYAFLLSIDAKTPTGRHDFNENLYVNVVAYETKNADNFDGVFESHRDYIDAHVLIDGEEKIFYGDRKEMSITKEYDKTGDYELLKGKDYSAIEYSKMQGIEFSVNEPHMAGYADSRSQIIKTVIKIKRASKK